MTDNCASGIKFDLLAELYHEDNLIASGTLGSVSGGSSGFNNAHLYSIPISILTPTTFSSSDTLSLNLLVRNACMGSGHNSGTARLWYGDSSANSNAFLATTSTANYFFLNSTSALATSTGNMRQSVDIAAGAKCSSYKSFGTWNITF